MDSDALEALANAFHAAAEDMRTPLPMIFDPQMHPVPPDATQETARRICADVLKAIGDVYLGQAVQYQ